MWGIRPKFDLEAYFSNTLKAHLHIVLLSLIVAIYVVFFSVLSIRAHRNFQTHHLDLTTNYQPAYNTYMAMKNVDFSRILELTDPYGSGMQLKRTYFHADLILIFYSLFLFIFRDVEMMLILQVAIVSLGAYPIYLICNSVLKKLDDRKILSFVLAVSYLLNPYMSVTFFRPFHSIVPAATTFLFMFYFWVVKRRLLSTIFFFLTILSKEQVSLTTLFFGIFILKSIHFSKIIRYKFYNDIRNDLMYAIFIILVSILWFSFANFWLIPVSRGNNQSLYLSYYHLLGDTPLQVLENFVFKFRFMEYFSSQKFFEYVVYVVQSFTPFVFASPTVLLMLLPEISLNVVSENKRMSFLLFHYHTLILAIGFLASAYGFRNVLNLFNTRKKLVSRLILVTMLISIMGVNLTNGKNQIRRYFRDDKTNQEMNKMLYKLVLHWKKLLDHDEIKIAASSSMLPHFSDHRYLYIYPGKYKDSDYVIVYEDDIPPVLPSYNNLLYERFGASGGDVTKFVSVENNKNFRLLYKNGGFKVYKQI